MVRNVFRGHGSGRHCAGFQGTGFCPARYRMQGSGALRRSIGAVGAISTSTSRAPQAAAPSRPPSHALGSEIGQDDGTSCGDGSGEKLLGEKPAATPLI